MTVMGVATLTELEIGTWTRLGRVGGVGSSTSRVKFESRGLPNWEVGGGA